MSLSEDPDVVPANNVIAISSNVLAQSIDEVASPMYVNVSEFDVPNLTLVTIARGPNQDLVDYPLDEHGIQKFDDNSRVPVALGRSHKT